MVENPKLPFNLATVSGARLIGYQGDANSRNAALTNKDPLLHEDYAKCVRDVVGDLTISTTTSNRGGFCEGTYFRTNVGRLITTVTKVAGIDNSVDQKLANNPLPFWLHVCDPLLIGACISALWDAEGSVNYRDLKLAQAVPLDAREEWMLPKWPANIPFRQLQNELQGKMVMNPPLLLVSASLLLGRLGVISRILPVKASTTSTGPTAYWQLRIHHDESIRRFRRQINLLSMHKAKALQATP
ncbi:MAG TPA: LAGLIDADG family homing endonuclease [Nitrososphaerales archaeon]|nr:LAGLIDADG family homing endonuclease [Nitrososphaerales archaeon]